MIKLIGSYNSRFFACLTPSEVRLYRGIAAGAGLTHANEASLVFSRGLDESLGLDLIRVSNQGDLFFLGKKGLFRLRNDRSAKLEVVNDVLCALARGEESARIGRVMVDADGREVCYEVISPEGGLKGKFLKMLGGGKKAGGESLMAHQLVYFNTANPRTNNLPPVLIDPRREYGFRWSMSPSGRFFVQARPEKKAFNLDVIDVTDDSIIADFQMALAPIAELWVNDAGVMMVDVRQVGEEKLIIALPDRATRHHFCPPPSYRVVHLGRLHVALLLESQRRLHIYDYSGKLTADVDLQPLRQLGYEYHFNFNDRDHIDVLVWSANKLHIQHADFKSIVIDAKRWDMTARQQQAEVEHQLVQDVTVQHQADRKRIEDVQLSRQLLDAVQAEVAGSALPQSLPRLGERSPIPAPEPLEGAPPTTPLPIPTSGPLPPPPPLPSLGRPTRPTPPPTEAEGPPPLPIKPLAPPPSTEGVARPTNPIPSPSTEPVGRPLPPPPPLPPEPVERPAPPAPPEPAPLAFLKGGPPMPPPDTENALFIPGEPPAPPPPPPTPPPPPKPVVATPSVPGEFANTAEVDAELERLRMTYIAGEVTREVYYSRRSELETLRKGLQAAGPAAPVSGPRRLDLDLDLSVPEEKPTVRKRPEGLSLELPLPGDED